MASDDRRPDDSRSRFSMRTFLSPEDDVPRSGDEPGDGSARAHDLAPESFGTGGVDDDALDALVRAEASEFVSDVPTPEAETPAFVWAAGDVPEPVPGDLDAAAPMMSENLEALPVDAVSETGSSAPDAEAEDAPTSAQALDTDWTVAEGDFAQADSDDAFTGLQDADALPAAGFDGLEEDAALPKDSGAEPSVGEPIASEALSFDAFTMTEATSATPDASASEVLPTDATAAEQEALDSDIPTFLPATSVETMPDADVALPDAEPNAVEPPTVEAGVATPTTHPPVIQATAETEETAATTDAVDDAFEAQADAEKADAPGLGSPEGTLEVPTLGPEDFEPEELRQALRTMMVSRRLDQKMLTLLKQGKGFFHIGSAGHEASQIAVARHFEGGKDWFCFYYRDLATALTVGVTPTEVLRAHFGKAADVFGGGRQMPEHFGHRDLNILSTSSSVAAQYVPAVGFALGVKREDAEAVSDGASSRAVYVSGGEGSTSQGAFHEALNWAAREALPVLFHVQDNKFAISVPVDEQTAGGSIWHLLGGYAGLQRIRYDGTDFFQSVAAARAAMDHIRAGHGPVALHADLVRLLPHSSSDDHRKYREAEAIEADAARDPIPRLAARLVEAGILTEDEIEAMQVDIAAEIDRLARAVEAEPDPDPSDALRHVYYEGPDERQYEVDGETGDLIVMVDAINHALDEEMARDERVLVYGEDVGGGKGGVFTATRGLTEKHGRHRCFNSPLAEHSVIGSAVGLAASGYMPVVEIQFADYIWPGMQPLRNQVASMRYRSNGTWANPMVLRVPCGGYIHGGLCHSQNVEAMFSHWPGLHVVMPSNAADAKGLLKTAIRGQDPVIFLEHKALYRQGPARRPEPHADYLVPLGKAVVAREGTDLTIVTWGAIVYKALNVAKALEKEGVSVEVVDVRSILPFDRETVLASARKTGRVLVAYEDHEFMGFGAEVAAQVSDAAFGHLDAPVKRVGGAFSSIPYADALEKAVLPQDDDVLAAARDLLAY